MIDPERLELGWHSCLVPNPEGTFVRWSDYKMLQTQLAEAKKNEKAFLDQIGETQAELDETKAELAERNAALDMVLEENCRLRDVCHEYKREHDAAAEQNRNRFIDECGCGICKQARDVLGRHDQEH